MRARCHAAMARLVACLQALIEELAFHRVAREAVRGSEMLARGVISAAAKLKLAQRRRVERISGEAGAVRYRGDFFKAALGAVALGDRNGAIERDDRRGTDRHQRVVER